MAPSKSLVFFPTNLKIEILATALNKMQCALIPSVKLPLLSITKRSVIKIKLSTEYLSLQTPYSKIL